MSVEGTYTVDWQRRRLLPARQAHPGGDPARTHCLHGSRLTEWCPECVADLDAIAADLKPGAA